MRKVVSHTFAALLVMSGVVLSDAPAFTQNATTPAAKAPATKLTGKEAVALVEKMPEVKSWKAAVLAAKRKGVTANVELDRTEGDDHVVHVFEVVMDSPDDGHTATFNWYHVNARTRKITKEF